MREFDMLRGSLGFLILAVLVGFAGIAAGARVIARAGIFLLLLIPGVTRVFDVATGRTVPESFP